MSFDTAQLDPAQRQIVSHTGGPLLVLGSPGTGKTTVLVERWVHLGTTVTQPHRVLFLVPTRERALALRDELPWRLPQQAILDVPVHTWHALAYHLVTRYYRKLGYDQAPVRLTTAEQWTVVRDLLTREEPEAWGSYAPHITADAFVGEVADFCVRAGHRGLSDDDLRELGQVRPEHASVANFALRYRAHLKATAALDYAELVQAASRLLDLDTDVALAVRRRFTHVLVDDAQELAPAQLHLLERLNTDHLVCAGDPDSAIEAFRGADPTWLDRFGEVVSNHERMTLTTCHRFGPVIGKATNDLISHAPDGTHRSTEFAGDPTGTADFRSYATMAGELEAVARELRSAHLLDGVAYDDMAVLLAQPAAYGHILERVLTDFGVPFRISSGDRPLGAEPAVRAVLDVCRLALGETADDLCKAVLSSPLVGLHPYRVRDLARAAYLGKTTLLEATLADTSPEIDGLRTLLDAAGLDPDEVADATFARVFGASAWFDDLVDKRRTDRTAAHHLDALRALSEALGHFVERRAGGTMRDYLDSSIDGGAGFSADTWAPSERSSGVHIVSLHRSKGQEWQVVCIPGVAEGQLPKAHRAQGLFDPWALERGSAVDRALAQLDEERRTFYVALSRARGRVLVTCSPGVRQATPSRFCEEAFGPLPEPISVDADAAPMTLSEAAARHRRTLADDDSSEVQKTAASAALARITGIDPAAWWWRRDWTDGPVLVPGGKLTTSYSRIGKFDECPLRYVLESVLGLDPQSTYQMKFGSLVHLIIERSDPKVGDLKTWDEALAVYKAGWESHHKDYPNRPFALTYWRYGLESLKRWWRTEREAGETVAVEYAFDDLDVDGHTIRGRIDRIAKGGKGLILSDYKTSKNAIGWQEAKESLQLAIYYKAAKEREDLRAQGEPQRMQLVYPGIERQDRQDGGLSCDKRYQNPEEAEETLGRLGEILQRAAAEEFSPSPEADCRWCHMRQLCPRWPEGKEIPS